MELLSSTIEKSFIDKHGKGFSTAKGFTMTQNWLLKSQNYTRNEKNIAIVLSSFAMNKKECWPSQKIISKRAGLCLTTTKETINSLVSKGLIEKRLDGKRRSACYKLNY